MTNKKRGIRSPVAWLTASLCISAYAALAACGGSDDDVPAPAASPPPAVPAPAPTPAPPPAAATAMLASLANDVGRSVTRMASLEGGAVFVNVPGDPLAPNIVSVADGSAGSPPNTWTFRGAFDGNDNGIDETTLDGRLTYVSDPTDFFAGFNGASGSATVAIDIPGVMHVYRGETVFTIGANEHRLAGTGTFTNPLTGAATEMIIDRNQPLAVKRADGTASALPNACAHSLDGLVRVTRIDAAGTLAGNFTFAHDSATVKVGGVFTDKSNQSQTLPESQVELGCASTTGTGSIGDWNGRYRVRWACLPHEYGEFSTTISVKDAKTLQIIDDGDTAADAYEASLLGAGTRAVRGFFIDGPAGSRYREDFNWTLNLDGSGFSQSSRYVYFEGGQSGKGGICVARATRI